MKVKEALAEGIKILKHSNIEAPVVDTGVILSFVLQRDRVFLYSHGDYELTEDEKKRFLDAASRRAGGMPVQYITGCQEFMSLSFRVTPDVLIPRHDTEILVETVINLVKIEQGRPSQQNFLDIGTGSGCIAVSLAYYMDNCHVTAIDISEKALDVARINAVKNGVADRIAFVKSDMFSGLPGLPPDIMFDAIVSNPPYIPQDDIKGLQAEVREYEPHTALDGGNDGLCCYRAIVEVSPRFLKRGGLLAFEVGYNQADAVCGIMMDRFADILVTRDLTGHSRVVSGKLTYI